MFNISINDIFPHSIRLPLIADTRSIAETTAIDHEECVIIPFKRLHNQNSEVINNTTHNNLFITTANRCFKCLFSFNLTCYVWTGVKISLYRVFGPIADIHTNTQHKLNSVSVCCDRQTHIRTHTK